VTDASGASWAISQGINASFIADEGRRGFGGQGVTASISVGHVLPVL
jgi:hypothetical protein